MTATNDYKQYAGGSGANAETQAGYLADTTLIDGSVTGILPSTRFNKICRQATMASAALGQIIANAGVNILDDGDVSNFAAQLLAALTAAIGGDNASPVGTIIQFSGSSVPANYLACPNNNVSSAYPGGNLVSRTTYASLFAAIGTTWGAGDGSTTFGLPYFPTGYSATAGTPGSVTVGQVINHVHAPGVGSGFLVSGTGSNFSGTGSNSGAAYTGAPLDPSSHAASGGSANLAAGTNLLFCVKYR